MSYKQEKAFNTNKYLRYQLPKIEEIVKKDHAKLYVEFGGKIIQDRHSARVMPGYEEDTKLKILKRLCKKGEAIFVVSCRDVMRGRIRGDFKITYDREAIRTIKELKKRGLPICHVVLGLLPKKNYIPAKIRIFEKKLQKLGLKTHRFIEIKDYPSSKINMDELKANPFIELNKKIVCIISPGGGSGKFGICLSQLYHEMASGVFPSYLKFETFPVHDLALNHPLNLAYMAASADFYDVVMKDMRHGKGTSYNRDLENYELLNSLAKKFPKEGAILRKISSATNMGVNMLSRGIINDEIVQKEAAAEITRRLIRYKFEVAEGKEDNKVLERVRQIIKML